MDTETKIEASEREYKIGDGSYRMPEGLSWQQNKWLGEHIFKGVDLTRLDYGTIHDLLREKGPLLMAICLVEEGQTRAQHSRLPWATISSRADHFAAELTGQEVAPFGLHFFQSCQPASMVMLMPGRQMQAEVEALAARLRADGEHWVEHSLVALSNGDLTKLGVILAEWGPAESDPYLKRCLERQAVDRAILGWCGVELPWVTPKPAAKRAQQIGEFCGGSCVEECRAYFGDGLAQACRTCPN